MPGPVLSGDKAVSKTDAIPTLETDALMEPEGETVFSVGWGLLFKNGVPWKLVTSG